MQLAGFTYAAPRFPGQQLAGFSYGSLQPAPDKKCSPFTSCRGSLPSPQLRKRPNVQLVRNLFSLYTPMTTQRLPRLKSSGHDFMDEIPSEVKRSTERTMYVVLSFQVLPDDEDFIPAFRTMNPKRCVVSQLLCQSLYLRAETRQGEGEWGLTPSGAQAN